MYEFLLVENTPKKGGQKMSEHYFSEKPEVESNRRKIECTLRNHPFAFMTDRGVFSKREVDFGTQLLIETFAAPEIPGDILDVGCGYGPIGLSIAKSEPDRMIDMIDINERAIELAELNARINNIQNVRVFQSNLFENLEGKWYAAILANPPIRAGKQVVHHIFEKSFDHLKDHGELWIVIQKKQGAPSAKQKLETLFRSVEVAERKKGYYIFKAKKD